MKKVLFGALAAATLLGTVSTASAQMIDRYSAADEFGAPSGAIQQNWYGWLTTPYDLNSPASIGYNRNIAEPTNVGG